MGRTSSGFLDNLVFDTQGTVRRHHFWPGCEETGAKEARVEMEDAREKPAACTRWHELEEL